MNYSRLAGVILAGAIGLGGSYAILAADNAPRWLVAVSGLLGLVGITATLALILIAWVVIGENVRLRFRIGKPDIPLALSQNEAALIGNVRFRHYPVGRWGVIVINNRFLFGFMTIGAAEYHSFAKDTAA